MDELEIKAHDGVLVCLALNNSGTILATASDKVKFLFFNLIFLGTLIRLFDTRKTTQIYEFRRGSVQTNISHLAFDQ